MIEIPTKKEKIEEFGNEALANLLKKIQDESDKEIENIQNKTKLKLEEIEKETQKLVEEVKEKELAKETSRIDFLKKRTETEYQQEARKIKIEAKEMLIDEVYDIIETEFSDFRKTKEYEKFLKKTLLRGTKNMRLEEVKIFIDEKDNKIFSKIIDNLSKNEGINCTLDKSSLKTIGGFILTDVRERVRIDYTLENLLDVSKERIRTKINELLFE